MIEVGNSRHPSLREQAPRSPPFEPLARGSPGPGFKDNQTPSICGTPSSLATRPREDCRLGVTQGAAGEPGAATESVAARQDEENSLDPDDIGSDDRPTRLQQKGAHDW